MSNIHHLPLPSSSQKWEELEELLHISSRTKQGEKNSLNVWDEWFDVGSLLPSLGMDPLVEKDGQVLFGSTEEGCAAMCSFVLVHDIPALTNIAPFFVDGHTLWVSKDELASHLTKASSGNKDELVAWIREGCVACAHKALDIDHPLSWPEVEPSLVESVLKTIPEASRVLSAYCPNKEQDAFRYASAFHMGHINLPKAYPQVQLDSGVANEYWQSVLTSWDNISKSAAWQSRRVQKRGIHEIGALLSHTVQPVEIPYLKHRLTTLLIQGLAMDLDIEERTSVLRSFSSLTPDATQQDINMIVGGLVQLSMHENLPPNEAYKTSADLEESDNLKEILRLFYYAQYASSNNNTDRLLSCAIFYQGVPNPTAENIKDQFIFLTSELKKAELSSSHLEILAFFTPWVLDDIVSNLTLPQDEKSDVFRLASEANLFFAWEVYRDQVPIKTYSNILTTLIKNGWAQDTLSLETQAKQDIWLNIVETLVNEDMDDPQQVISKYWPILVEEAANQNKDFASNLFGVLLNHSTPPESIFNHLLPHIDWAYTFNEFNRHDDQETMKTLAEAVASRPEMSFKMKMLANRQLSEDNHPSSVVPFRIPRS